MKNIFLNVSKNLCAECSMALRRFIGKMDSVDAINVENGQVVIHFDEGTVGEDFLRNLTHESMSRPGYKIFD